MTDNVVEVKKVKAVTLFQPSGGSISYLDASNVDVSRYNQISFTNTVKGKDYHVKSNLRYTICTSVEEVA